MFTLTEWFLIMWCCWGLGRGKWGLPVDKKGECAEKRLGTSVVEKKRKAAFESSRQIISKSFQSFFVSGQNWGHQGLKFKKKIRKVFDDKIFNVKGKATILIPSCLSRQGASNHISNDLERSSSKFDLRSSQAKVTWWSKWVILHISRFAWPRRMHWHQSHVSNSFGSTIIGKLQLVTSGDLKWPSEG